MLARTTDRVGDAIETLQEYGISQMPVSEDAEGDAIESASSGSINEKGLLERAYRDPSVVERTVGEVMDQPLPTDRRARRHSTSVRAAVRRRAGARRRCAAGAPAGVVTKLDLLEYLHRARLRRAPRLTPGARAAITRPETPSSSDVVSSIRFGLSSAR